MLVLAINKNDTTSDGFPGYIFYAIQIFSTVLNRALSCLNKTLNYMGYISSSRGFNAPLILLNILLQKVKLWNKKTLFIFSSLTSIFKILYQNWISVEIYECIFVWFIFMTIFLKMRSNLKKWTCPIFVDMNKYTASLLQFLPISQNIYIESS